VKAKLKSRRLRTLEELWAIEEEFPLAFAPDPVHLALKWGLPLSENYLKHRKQGKSNGNGMAASTHPRR
jgi:hypothetical protein